MQQERKYTLAKQERLKSRKAIEALFASGTSFSVYPFKVVYQIVPTKPTGIQIAATHLQCAFSVSKRHFKKATLRNRMKRLMREAYRLQNGTLKQAVLAKHCHLQLFIIYVGKEVPVYALVAEKTGALLKRLVRITHEAIAIPA